MIRLTLDDEAPDGYSGNGDVQVEVVGSVEEGIRAAEWSPDDEQVVLVTGQSNLSCFEGTRLGWSLTKVWLNLVFRPIS